MFFPLMCKRLIPIYKQALAKRTYSLLLSSSTSSSLEKRLPPHQQRRGAKRTIDPIDLATGLEKRELLAKLAGNDDPWDQVVLKRGPGTRECPNEIPSAFDCRTVGCICDEDATSINWMMLYQGTPKRCECGYWYTLVHKAPL